MIVYDDILYNLNDIEKNNFEKIFLDEKNNYLSLLIEKYQMMGRRIL